MKYLFCCLLGASAIFAQTDSALSHQKSIKFGSHLSVFSTVVPVAYGLYSAEHSNNDMGPTIAAAGFLFGPSIGLLYAEDGITALRGIAIRAGALYLLDIAASKFDVFEGNEKNRSAYAIAGVAVVVGLFGVISDFSAVPSSVRKYNEKHHAVLMPIVDPITKTVGINITLQK